MREIKFKYGYSDSINTFEKAFTLEEIEQGLQFEEISDSPLLKNYKIVYKRQYTGLKDAINKNEVYEHDIINLLGVGFLKVEWDYRDTGWVCLDKHYKKRNLAEVILNGGIRVGKIYENPDLLKG